MGVVSSPRMIFESDPHVFWGSVRRFADHEVGPYLREAAWHGQVDRELYRKAGKLGLLGIAAEERSGGGALDDFRFDAVLIEELARAGGTAVAMTLSGFNDLVVPYLISSATKEQKHQWLAPLCTGERIGALAMTEPGAGSDLVGPSTAALADGDELVLNGTKTFISNGVVADTYIVAVRTDPDAAKAGMSLVLVDADTPGFSRSGPLKKVGLPAQDTAELSFVDARVPVANLLGQRHQGFQHA